MLYRLLITILSVSFAMLPVSAIADSSSQRTPSRTAMDTPVQLVRACSEECAALDKRFIDERTILEKQSDRQYAQLKDAFEWTAKGVGALVAVALALFYFLFGRTGKEARDQIDRCVHSEVDKLVEKDLKPMREDVTELKKEVEQLRSFRNRRVIWIASTNDDIDGTQSAFNQVGLMRVDVQTPLDVNDVTITDCDLVLLSYDGAPLTKQLLETVANQLLALPSTIHLVIYTFGNGSDPVRLEKEQFDILNKLKWFSMANFPSTMVAQVVSLVRGSVSTIRR